MMNGVNPWGRKEGGGGMGGGETKGRDRENRKGDIGISERGMGDLDFLITTFS